MDQRRIGAGKDFGAAMRAAKRLGDHEVAIVQGLRRCRRVQLYQRARRCSTPVPGEAPPGFGLRALPPSLAAGGRDRQVNGGG